MSGRLAAFFGAVALLSSLAAAGTAAPGAATLKTRCDGATLVVTLVPDPAQTIDRVTFSMEGRDDFVFDLYQPPYEVRYREGIPNAFRIRAELYYQGTLLGTVRSARLGPCGGGPGGTGTLTSRCIGTGIYAKLTPKPGVRVTRVDFPSNGRSNRDTTPPFEWWYPPASFGGAPSEMPQTEHYVLARLYSGSAHLGDLTSRGKKCPAVIRRRPPLASKIVEGLSIGGVAVGMHWNEAEVPWGTPAKKACHGGGGGFGCAWDTRGGRDGPLAVGFGGRAFTVQGVSVYTEAARTPKYRRWKTANGIGVGSPLAGLERAYGAKLHKVPFRHAGRLRERDHTYYVLTPRAGSAWVTSFFVPVFSDTSQTYKPWQIRRIERIGLESAAGFRQSYRNYAPPSWRP